MLKNDIYERNFFLSVLEKVCVAVTDDAVKQQWYYRALSIVGYILHVQKSI